MYVLRCNVVIAHQWVYVLQVMAAVARGYGCLTSVSSYFQFFEPCMTGTAGGKSILHQSEGESKKSVWVRRLPFLVETSARGGFLWTVSTAPDEADGSNRKSLTGLDEKLRGEGTPPPLDQKCRSDGSWFAKILRLRLFS